MSCAECFSGAIHEGTPTGKVATIHGLPTYVAEPADGVKPKGVIVFIPDAFGWEFVNNRLLCDGYAKEGGFLVYLPDFMNGKAVDPIGIELMDKILAPGGWYETLFVKPYYIALAIYYFAPFAIGTRVSVTKPILFKFFQDLRTSPPPFPTPDLKIGAAGFCWGGKYTFLLAADTPSSRIHPYSSTSAPSTQALAPLITCGFTAHPSGLSIPADVENVILPLSVIVGDNDMAHGPKDVHLIKDILEIKKRGDHEVNIIPGAKHGFSVRTDPKDKYQLECGEKSDKQALEWFSKWLA